MSSDEQKCREKFYFKLFKERYDKWRDGEEKHENGEGKPDFLIKYPDKMLGIELTEPFKLKGQGQTVSPQQREGSLQEIVSKAKLFYEERDNPHLQVDVRFNPTFEKTQITAKKTEELSQQLAKFVEKELHSTNSQSFLIERPNGLPEIYKISITTGVPEHCGRWTKPKASWAKRIFIDELQACINKKNEKYDGYIINCDECWLLMVADGSNPAQCFVDDNNSEVFNHIYQSKFSKTFYLEVTGKPIKLKTTGKLMSGTFFL